MAMQVLISFLIISNLALGKLTVTQTRIVETGASGFGQVGMYKGATGTFLINIETTADSAFLVSRKTKSNQEAKRTYISPRPPVGIYISLHGVEFNKKGEPVALVSFRNPDGVLNILLINGETGKQLTFKTTSNSGPRLSNTITWGQSNFSVLSVDLKDASTNRTLERFAFVNLDNLAIISSLDLPNDGDVDLALDPYNFPKVLVRGLGSIKWWDPVNSKTADLITYSPENSTWPELVQLSNGVKYVKVADKLIYPGKVLLVQHEPLFNGSKKIDFTYPIDSELKKLNGGDYFIRKSPTSLTVTNLQTSKIEVSLEDFSRFTDARDIPTVSHLMRLNLYGNIHTIVGVVGKVNAHSYLPGTRFTVFDVTTNEILTTQSSDRDLLYPNLDILENKQVISSVRSWRFYGDNISFRLINALTGEPVLDSIVDGLNDFEWVGPIVTLPNRKIVILLVGRQSGRVLIQNVQDPSDRVEIKVPFINGNILYGYTPFEFNSEKLIMPRLTPASNYSQNVLGFVEFKIE